MWVVVVVVIDCGGDSGIIEAGVMLLGDTLTLPAYLTCF